MPPLSLYSLLVMSLLSRAAFGFAPGAVVARRGQVHVVSTSTTTRLFATPLDQVVRLRGKVDEGYGRGGKKLGFPTANLPSSLFQNALEQVPTGVYIGWALIEGAKSDVVGRGIPQKAAVNVGYSPTFEGQENKEKIVEAHLILEDGDSIPDFYNEVMRLSLVGFLRPEKKFDSFPDLMAAITNDVETAKTTLSDEAAPYVSFKTESFLADISRSKPWIGKDGGDADASWEFQDWNEAVGE